MGFLAKDLEREAIEKTEFGQVQQSTLLYVEELNSPAVLCAQPLLRYVPHKMKALQPFPSIALGAFSEDLVASRRVVIFGNALSGLAETLVERGARLVHVYDENPARVAEATARSTLTQVSFAPLGPGGIAARDGAFDVGFIDEISQFATATNVVTRLRRALTARGVALVSTVNPDKKLMYSLAPESANALGLTRASTEKPLSYYDLYDIVTSEFDEVRMVGQTPFVGYALADFSPETDVEFSIDTALVPGGAEEPEFFIAVCSHFPITTESFCVVQMAAETLLGSLLSAPSSERLGSSAAKATPSRDSVKEGESKDAALKDANLDAQRLHGQLNETQRLLTSEREARVKAEQLLANVNLELQHRDAWVAELEKRATAADERADAAEAAVDRLESRAKQQASRVDEAQAQSRQTELSRQVASLTQVRRTLETDLAQANDSVSRLQAALDQSSTQRASLEAQLETQQQELAQVAKQHAKASELETKLAALNEQNTAVRADLQTTLADLERTERQLTTQGQEVRRLQIELTDTERFAAVLIAQREAPRLAVSDDHLGNQGSTCTAPAEGASSAAVAEPSDTFGLVEALETVVAVLAAEVQAPEPPAPEAPAATQPKATPAIDPTPSPELEATIQALRWTIEELEQRLESKSQEEVLLARLHAAQQQ